MTPPEQTRPLLVVVGKGTEMYRGYLLRSVAHRFRVWLFSEQPPTWEAPDLFGHTHVDTSDAAAMRAAAAPLAPDGVLTWDDTRVVQAAELAEALGVPGVSRAAALCCRDKHRTREALAAAGVPQATSALVTSLPAAREAADQIGYPLVLKPRALNASIGVVRVDSPEDLGSRFRLARGAIVPGARITEVQPGGVLVEEYLDGPEVSVDAAWQGGRMAIAFVARKEIGYAPHFEEIGHLVHGRDPLLVDTELREVIEAAHQAICFHTGWTHSELRLTAAGPKVVEINARIGGDRIPDIARLALGVEAAPIAAAIACRRKASIQPTLRRVAAVRFLYPAADCIVRAVHIDRHRLPPSVDAAEPVAIPGQELLLPPGGHVSSRYALITVVGDTEADVRADLDVAARAVHLETLRRPAARRPPRVAESQRT